MGLRKFVFAACIILMYGGCTKTENITNNIPVYNTPGFTVQGITDVRISRNGYAVEMPFSVVYHDSVQEHVQLSISELPSGIQIDTNWLKGGIPTFNTSLRFFDSLVLDPALPGFYPISITATGEKTGAKYYTCTIYVDDIPSITDVFIKKYSCSIAGVSGTYTDSIEKDPLVTNKVWFCNFANTGTRVAAVFTDNNSLYYAVNLPLQFISSVPFNGTGSANKSAHSIRINAVVGGVGKSITMN